MDLNLSKIDNNVMLYLLKKNIRLIKMTDTYI